MEFLKSLPHELYVFIISMIPIAEIRGGIPAGYAYNIPLVKTFIISVIGNSLPIPFVILFGKNILKIFEKLPLFKKYVLKIEKNSRELAKKHPRATWLALAIFTGIPLPMTGAWSASFIAAVLDIRIKYAFPSIFAGVIIAGILVSFAVYGLFGGVGNLLY